MNFNNKIEAQPIFISFIVVSFLILFVWRMSQGISVTSEGTNDKIVAKPYPEILIEKLQVGSPLRIMKTATEPPFILLRPGVVDVGVIDTSLSTFSAFAPVETQLFKRICQFKCAAPGPKPLVVDVGANIGYFTLYAANGM